MDKFVEKNWPGGYITLDTGDFLYVPKTNDYTGHQRLIEPFREEPIISKFCNQVEHFMNFLIIKCGAVGRIRGSLLAQGSWEKIN